MALVFSYIRFSTKKQLEGDSLRRQVEKGDEWIRRNGHTQASLSLRDIGVSAFRGKNKHTGALSKFLEAIEGGRVPVGSILLVENLDRLSRQAMGDAKRVFEAILEAGVSVAVLMPSEAIYTKDSIADPFGLIVPLMAFHLAHQESLKKSERLRALWDKKRKDATTGKKFDRKCPSWVIWDEEGQTFVLHKKNAAIISYIFERTADGIGQRVLLAELQKRWHGIGYKKAWNLSYLNRLLNDRSVLGERQPKTLTATGEWVAVGEPILGYYPAVIDEALWIRAQASKAAKLKVKGRPAADFVNLFVGLCWNVLDESAMNLQTSPYHDGTRQRRMVSYAYLKKEKGACPLSVAYWDLEKCVLSFVSELRVEDLQGSASVSDLRAKEQELLGYEGRLKEIEQAMADPLADDFLTLRNSARIVRERIEVLKKEVQKLKADISAEQPLQHCHEILQVLNSVEGDELQTIRLRLRSLLGEIIEKIYVLPEKHLGRIWFALQIHYVGGGRKQVLFIPNGQEPWIVGHSQQFKEGDVEDNSLYNYWSEKSGADLREWRKWIGESLFGHFAKTFFEPTDFSMPETLPLTIGACGEVFIDYLRSKIAKDSFRVVPSKIRRFVDFLGADLPCVNLNSSRWAKYETWLRGEIAASRMAVLSGRVNRDRAREFVRWLVENGACGHVDGLEKGSDSALTG